MNKSKVMVLTQTALMLAVLISWQFLSKSFGQLVTGSGVNLILLVSVFVVGLTGGLVVAGISPFVAFAFGIGPVFIQVVFFVAVGNMLLVGLANLICRKHIFKTTLKDIGMNIVGLGIGSLAKFGFFYVGLVSFALPLIPNIKAPQIQALTLVFTWPQLITAFVGSVLAVIALPIIGKSLKIDN